MAKKKYGMADARRAILTCGRKGANSLDLSNMELTELPVEIAKLAALRRLDLSKNKLTVLPPEVTMLTALEDLDLGHNQLQELPRSFANLSALTELDLMANPLEELPPEIGSLTALRMLNVHRTQLRALPPEIAALTELRGLFLSSNRLTTLPSEIGALKKLHSLFLWDNQITELPPEIGALTDLQTLDLQRNQITALPPEMAALDALTLLELTGNPLPASYFDALGQGLESLRALLVSLGGRTERLFEAKLLVTGEGKVGKSWAIAALRGASPNEEIGDDNTTWGIDRGTLSLPHPEFPGEQIVLNSWDFGGQRIYRVTHQFFFSEQAIYLLVWNPRAGTEQCRVQEWLRTIALRTGSQLPHGAEPDAVATPKAKVIMVATHAKDEGGSYVADYGKSSLDRDLRDMIVDEIEIDSREGFNIDSLNAMIARHAATLPGMGEPFNTQWAAAREATLAMREVRPRITFDEFAVICDSHGVTDREQQRSLAWTYLHSLGRAIWYGDSSPDGEGSSDALLESTIILDAVWLSRAFVQILDDKATVAAGGMLDHRWLRRIWTEHGRPEWHRYEPAEHEILKQVMRRFDVALPTRESDGRRSLVPQLVPHDRPHGIPWTDGASAPGARTIRMRCELGFEAIGLMPRLIAATEPWHVYVDDVGLFWERGVFLRDSASFENEAIVSLVGVERPRLDIVVSGDRPDFLMHEFYRALEAVLRFWKGMTREYSLGCPSLRKDGQPCTGLFNYEAIVGRIKEKVDTPFNCQFCAANWSAERLINGFEAMMVSDTYMLQHLYHRDQMLAPRICLLEPADKKLLRVASWAGFIGKRFKLTLLSELSGRTIASKEFTLTRQWVKWIRPVTKVASLMLTGAALPFGGDLANAFTEQSSVLEKLGALPEEDSGVSPLREHGDTKDIRLSPEEIANFAAFLAAIGLDPRKHGMDIARAPDGRWLWMSADEVRIYKPQAAA